MASFFTVLVFAHLKDQLGWQEKTFAYEPGITLGDIRNRVLNHLPSPQPPILLALNQQYAPAGTVIQAGDEIALIPPVSGG